MLVGNISSTDYPDQSQSTKTSLCTIIDSPCKIV